MSQVTDELLTVYIDGESKTGKGAAGKAIADSLAQEGRHVYYDVAGDFFRHYVALVRSDLGLAETDALPCGAQLRAAAQRIYDTGKVFEVNNQLGDLQRRAISKSVATLAELALVQKAGGEWWAHTAQQAVATGAEVMVLDGRNPRARIQAQAAVTGIMPRTALDLYMICDSAEAAQRVLLAGGITTPTVEQLETARNAVVIRREQDRRRSEHPFVIPTVNVPFVPGRTSVKEILHQSWQPHGDAELPITITLDNTHIAKDDMLTAVRELASAAVKLAPAAPAT